VPRRLLPAALADRVVGRGRLLLDWWRRWPPVARDGLLAALLAASAFVPALANKGTRLGELPYRSVDGLAVLAALAQSLPLCVRRRWPVGVLAVCVTGFAVQELRGYQTFGGIGVIVALYNAAAYQSRFRGRLLAALSVGYVLLAWAEHRAGSAARSQDFTGFYLSLACCWLFGAWMRTRRQREAERHRLALDEERTGERARIARELHDVVTHHVTAMVVQADAARYLAADPHKPAANLDAISETGRRALHELRDLLGVLDPTRAAPLEQPPGLGRVAALVEQTRAAGQPIEFEARGRRPELSAGCELAAYRVVQEALTNALKYAAGRKTEVRLDYRPDAVEIAVTTATATATTDWPSRIAEVGGSGRGLAGLRERVELFGGWLAVGHDDDGFVVHARIPARAPDAPESPS
jgi:signal transduction histidine kinase